jgi:hypothetical protein
VVLVEAVAVKGVVEGRHLLPRQDKALLVAQAGVIAQEAVEALYKLGIQTEHQLEVMVKFQQLPVLL